MNDVNYLLWSIIGAIFNYGPFLAAIAIGLLLPSIIVIASGITKKYPDHIKLTVIFALIIIGSTLSIAASGRIIYSEAEISANPNLLASAARPDGNPWFSRLAHLLLLSLSISEIFLWVLRKRKMGELQFILWSAVMTYYILSVIVSGTLGEFRNLEINVIYAPIVFTATALLASPEIKKTLNTLRWILLFPLIGSLIAIWLAPTLVLETGYKSLIPGFTIRLAGLTGHANSLGLISAIALLLEISKYIKSKPNMFFLLISSTNLILAQSKTAWVITAIGLATFFIISITQGTQRNNREKLALVLSILFCAGTAMLALIAAWKFDATLRFLAADRTGITSFTGRTAIWDITLNEFLNNPVSGYGPSIWDIFYRHQHGMLYVGQAHNQFIQTLGQAGLIGIISLLIYMAILTRNGFRGRNETYGFSILIVITLLIRGFSESPMRMIGIMDFDSFIHLLTFATIASLTITSKKPQLLIKPST